MSKLYRFFILGLILFSAESYAQAPDFMWAQQANGKKKNNEEFGRSVARDASGNVYVTGHFQDVISFGDTKLISTGGSDIFIVKYSPAGVVLWAKQAGGGDNDAAVGIAVDASGNAYITGHFWGAANIGNTVLSSSSVADQDLFVAKYDAAGNVVWAKKAGGTSNEFVSGITADASGNTYLTGYFSGETTFGSTKLTSAGSSDMFVAKYNASGSVVWARQAGGTAADQGRSITVDASGNTYLAGDFKGTATFGAMSLVSSENHANVFVAKYDAAGNVAWAKKAGGSDMSGHGIVVDGSGNTFVTGMFGGTATFDATTTLTSLGGDAIFVAKYDATGAVLWAKQAGSTGNDIVNDIALDGSGSAYITGYFSGEATFGSVKLVSAGGPDMFVAKYDGQGNTLWAQRAGGAGYDSGQSISVDPTGDAYITGHFYHTAAFGSSTLTSSGGPDAFVARYSATGNLLWAQNPVGMGAADYGRSIAVDAQGNTYVTGYFSGEAVFGNTKLVSAGSNDVFVAKYDAAGNVLWAKKAGGIGWDYGFAIAVDGSGNAYITGYFSGESTFGTIKLESTGGNDVFVAKYDGSGNVVWAKRAGGTGNGYGQSIAVDASGSVYLAGYFNGEANFGATTLSSAGNNDVFVAKYDATGNVVWAKQATSTNGGYGRGVALDASGNVYVVGEFLGTTAFGNTSLTSAGGFDVFVAKYNAAGTVVWAKRAGGVGNDFGNSITVDASGNAYISGGYGTLATFGSINLTNRGGTDAYLAKYNSEGNVVWARGYGSTGNDFGSGVALDGSGNPYMAGYFAGTVAFSTTSLISAGGADVFVVKLNPSGTFQWVQQAGGESNDLGYGIAVNNAGFAHITGAFYTGATFGNTNLSSNGTELFVAKLNNTATLTSLVNEEVQRGMSVYPNPFVGEVRISLASGAGKVHGLKVLDTKGQVVWEQKTIDAGSHTLDLAKLVPGVYLLQITTDRGLAVKRIVKQ